MSISAKSGKERDRGIVVFSTTERNSSSRPGGFPRAFLFLGIGCPPRVLSVLAAQPHVFLWFAIRPVACRAVALYKYAGLAPDPTIFC
jgi:hypothetical protein